jgi:hypothetical protein
LFKNQSFDSEKNWIQIEFLKTESYFKSSREAPITGSPVKNVFASEELFYELKNHL